VNVDASAQGRGRSPSITKTMCCTTGGGEVPLDWVVGADIGTNLTNRSSFAF
jgi:hypothetical protein